MENWGIREELGVLKSSIPHPVIPQFLSFPNFCSLNGNKPRLDIHRHVLQPVEHFLHFGPHDDHLLQHLLRAVVVAFGLNRHDLACEVRDGVLDLRVDDGERAVGIRDERALVEQLVELERDALAVRFGDPESNRAEAEARNVVYIDRATPSEITPLSASCCSAQRPEMSAFASSSAEYVSLSASRTALLPSSATWCGPRPCMTSCIRMWVKKASNATFVRSEARAPPRRSAPAPSRTSPPACSSASRASSLFP